MDRARKGPIGDDREEHAFGAAYFTSEPWPTSMEQPLKEALENLLREYNLTGDLNWIKVYQRFTVDKNGIHHPWKLDKNLFYFSKNYHKPFEKWHVRNTQPLTDAQQQKYSKYCEGFGKCHDEHFRSSI
jgi:hypothetical protein